MVAKTLARNDGAVGVWVLSESGAKCGPSQLFSWEALHFIGNPGRTNTGTVMNTFEEIDALVKGIKRAQRMLC